MNYRQIATLALYLGVAGLTNTAAHCTEPSRTDPVKIELGERPNQPHPLKTVIATDGFILRGGFPAISGDKSKVAIFKSEDAMGGSAAVDVIRLRDKKRLRHVSILSEDEGGRAPDEALQQKIRSRVASINPFLAVNEFAPMPVLYELPTYVRQNLPTEERFTHAGKTIVFHYATGTLTVSSTATGKEQLRVRQPVRTHNVPGGNPENDCVVQGTPVKGWFDEATKALVLEIQYVGTRDSCEQPEEWIIERMN